MDCGRFEHDLNEGGAETVAEGLAHARSCARCGAALAAARALDTALDEALGAARGRSAIVAPAGLAERVMERVARARQARLLAWIEPEVLPWWVRAAAEPATALSLALAALVLWQYPVLASLAAAAFQALASPAVATFVQQWAAPRFTLDLAAFSDPFVLAGLALAALPFAWWAGLAVYHWSGDPRALRTVRR
jgi:hypothetical protein